MVVFAVLILVVLLLILLTASVEGFIRFAIGITLIAIVVWPLKKVCDYILNQDRDPESINLPHHYAKQYIEGIKNLKVSLVLVVPAFLLHILWLRNITFNLQETTPIIHRVVGIVVLGGYGSFIFFMALAIVALKEVASYQRYRRKKERTGD